MLTLRLLSVDGHSPASREERTLDGGRFALGRGSENDWVLPDPGRVLSKQHCVIERRGPRWEVEDTSTNGVFHNNAPEPLGRGRAVPLSTGDRLLLGRYVFEVTVGPAADDPLSRFDALFEDTSRPPVRPGPLPPIDRVDAWPAAVSPRAPSGRPADAPSLPDWGPGGAEEDDLLGGPGRRWSSDGFDNERRPSDGDAFRVPQTAKDAIPDDFDDASLTPVQPEPPPPAFAAQPSPYAAQRSPYAAQRSPYAAQPPGAPGFTIPDDLDLDDLLAPVTPPLSEPDAGRVAQPAAAPAPARADTQAGEPSPSRPDARFTSTAAPDHAAAPRPTVPPGPPPATAADGERLVRAFLEGAGIAALNRGSMDDEALMRHAGQILRESVGGLAEVLAARDMVKAEFRLARTMIQADHNNPLKLCPTVEEKLGRVLGTPEPGYMAGLPAVREAVNDVRAHEMALLAGLQVALAALIAKFDPARLKQRLDSSSFLGGLFPAARKARYWEVYEALYESIAKDVADDFQDAYGNAVAEEYQHRLSEMER